MTGTSTAAPPSLAVPARWWREPVIAAGEEICVLVTLAPSGRLAAHNLHHARAWAAAGFRVIVVLIGDDIAAEPDRDELDFAAGVLMRANRGHDFGAWAAVLARLPALGRAGLLALANDSVFGPLAGFGALLDRVRGSGADHVGVTLSHEISSHFQSYLQFFKPGALNHPAFRQFWHDVAGETRAEVIQRCELPLLAHLVGAGLAAEAMFPLPVTITVNPTLRLWRELLDAGFPYLKIQLLRDNPHGDDLTGWRQALAARGFDPALAEAWLRTLPAAAALDFP